MCPQIVTFHNGTEIKEYSKTSYFVTSVFHSNFSIEIYISFVPF